jgi:hypothetical protein
LAKRNTRPRARRAKKSEFEKPFTDKEYRAYALAIGQVALAWNDLHENLGSLFCHLCGIGDGENKMQAAWQSLMADRAKRKMLQAAIAELENEEKHRNPKAEEEMKWLFGQLERLEIARNHVIHSPLTSFSHPIWRLFQNRPEGIAPDDIRGNRLALELRKKADLLSHYRAIRDEIMLFSEYVEAIEDAWHWGGHKRKPWPDRPFQPKQRPKNPRKALTPPDPPKQLPLLPPASEG